MSITQRAMEKYKASMNRMQYRINKEFQGTATNGVIKEFYHKKTREREETIINLPIMHQALTVLSTLQISSNLILTKNLGSRCYYYSSHFTIKETEAKR